MNLTDADLVRFSLFAGGVRELHEVVAGADSPERLAQFIAEWEQSKRRDGGEGVEAVPVNPLPRPQLGGHAEASHGDI